MFINDVELHLVELGRTGSLPPVRSLLVRLCASRGLEGWGEASLSWRPGELVARRDALLSVLAGRSLFDIEELHTLDALASPPLQSAVEMACWDLIGRAAGQPLCRLLGGEYRGRIPLAPRLSGRWPDRLARQAREIAGQGFHAQIITACGEAELDRQIVTAVRESVGDRVQLRLDAQASYTLDAVRDLCAALEPDPLLLVLDPLATRELYTVASLRRQTRVQIGVWRAVRRPADVLAMVRSGAADCLVVDLEQLGGISPARTCAQIADAAGVAILSGGRPSLGIATAAMLHLAAATPSLSGANESAYHQIRDDVLVEPLTVVGGMMIVPEGPGLGIEVDRAKLDRYAVG